ncbi:hypothetical protein SDC9_176870 [bioreactor metagenome]|uniref:Uncharacterized protein n=1 Tax=bioreactor metagenome TaxID=1076179 RepID=A0A645GR91_9ZZZZ
MVLHAGLPQVDLATELAHARLVGQRQRAPVLGHGAVGIGQVVGVEDDFLDVHLGPAHAQAVKAAEILVGHGHGFNPFGRRGAGPARRHGGPGAPRGWRGPS